MSEDYMQSIEYNIEIQKLGELAAAGELTAKKQKQAQKNIEKIKEDWDESNSKGER